MGGKIVFLVFLLLAGESYQMQKDVDDEVLTAEAEGVWPPPAGAIVSKQKGEGDFSTIEEALQQAPKDDGRLHVIAVKPGIYEEQITVTRSNVMLLGEGIGKTIITGSKSNATGTQTPLTATVTVLGHGFFGQDLTIRNTAGPDKGQALALRSNSNKSVWFRVAFEAYQDTVYVENNLQLFLECSIHGTVDFIFGNAKAFFYGCGLRVRRPVPGAHNVITGQGCNNASRESGFVFQSCRVEAAPGEDLGGVDTYLGRPWKNFSHVVFRDSFMGDVINATGWVAWKKDQEVGEVARSITYLEYNNNGPKADTSRRVNWPGFRVLTDQEAKAYEIDMFINASQWVPRPLQMIYRRPGQA